MIRLVLLICCIAAPAAAETIVAARTIRAQSIIGPDDLALSAASLPGGTDDAALLVGMEARVALYAGRPIRPEDVGTPAVVDRNGIVSLIFNANGLLIVTEGRALGHASEGDVIRVMNLGSRNTVTARIGPDGSAYVGGPGH